MRLIDADNVRDLFDTKFKETWKLILAGETHLDNLAEGFTEADRVIREMPTVDAVPVVRCKDCKYAYYYNEEGCRGFVCNGYFQYADVEPNDFCSYGEMRNNYE